MNEHTPREGDVERPSMSPDAFERAAVAIDLAQRRGRGLHLAVAAAIESSFRDGFDARDAASWQPIETAPKDGTKILVYTIHGDIELSDWYSVRSVSYEETEGGLYRKIVNEGYSGWNSNEPTHWLPLPPEPGQREGGE